jgi:hypothetical protein
MNQMLYFKQFQRYKRIPLYTSCIPVHLSVPEPTSAVRQVTAHLKKNLSKLAAELGCDAPSHALSEEFRYAHAGGLLN